MFQYLKKKMIKSHYLNSPVFISHGGFHLSKVTGNISLIICVPWLYSFIRPFHISSHGDEVENCLRM